ncbi:MAG: Zn-ribbon-containing protein [Gammaproteobacteria bacterium]|nr:Zn-ribbon-containing protein [Gammaproteobacteria bacterium]
MYAFDIIIKNKRFKEKHNQQYEDWIDWAYDYVFHLDRTGQIIKKDHPIIVDDLTLRVPVICPEKDSLFLKYCSEYSLDLIEKIEKNTGSTIESIFTGRDAGNPNYTVPENSSYYILRNGWESPLLCGDTHRPIPLYRFPGTDHNGVDYDNIYFWNQDFERLSGLWLSSGAYEAFTQEQMQNPFSSINKSGRKLCALVEKLTAVPTYYFLFNYRDGSQKQDQQRKCPITGNDWLIADKTSSDFIAFKCDESRLVSELSTNVNSEDES